MQFNSDNNLLNLFVLYQKTRKEVYLEKIINETESLVYFIINRYYNKKCHFDKIDYYQMLVMHYPQWILSYDPEGIANCSSYLYSCIRNSLLKSFRKENAQKRNTSMNIYFEEYINNKQTLEDVISDGNNPEDVYLMHYETKAIYDKLYQYFNDDAKYYIGHLEGYKVKNLAEIYDVSDDVVREKIKKIKRVLRKKPDILTNNSDDN